MDWGSLRALRQDRGALRAKIVKLAGSGRRLPRRLSRAARVALDLFRSAVALELRAGLRRREDARLIRGSGLFDVHFYRAQCAGDRHALADPIAHYLAEGAARGLDPSPFFDTSAYVERNPGLDPGRENPLAHHIRARAAARKLPAAPAADAPSPGEALLAAQPFRPTLRERAPCAVLVVDGTALAPGPDARAGRVVALVEALRGLGHPVTLFSSGAGLPAGDGVRAPGVQEPHGVAAARGHLEAEGYRYGLVLLAGPDETARHLGPVRAHAPGAVVVYDAAGVHGARLARDAEAAGDPAARAEAERLRRVEKVNAGCADLVLAFTAHDRDALLAEVPGARVEVLPHEAIAVAATEARLSAILSGSAFAGAGASKRESAA
jgi:hypothetical protein